jgi:hypothetical protein
MFGTGLVSDRVRQRSPLSASGHVEGIALHLANSSVRPGFCDRSGRFRGKSLKRTAGADDKMLNDGGGQNSFALADLADLVTKLDIERPCAIRRN